MAETSRLPTPIAETWDWQRRGNCRNMGSAVFFPPDGERSLARASRIAAAKKICRTCPVITECRDHAFTVAEPFGVWGGLDETERRVALARRRKPAPASSSSS